MAWPAVVAYSHRTPPGWVPRAGALLPFSLLPSGERGAGLLGVLGDCRLWRSGKRSQTDAIDNAALSSSCDRAAICWLAPAAVRAAAHRGHAFWPRSAIPTLL